MITIHQFNLVIINHRYKSQSQNFKRSRIPVDINNCLIKMMRRGRNFKNLLILAQIQQLILICLVILPLKKINSHINLNQLKYLIDLTMLL